MNKLSLVAVVFSLLCCFSQAARAGAIDIDFWELATRVNIDTNRDRDLSFEPQTPFLVTQSAGIGPSTAQTNFDIAWDTRRAQFLYDISHTLQDVVDTSNSISQTSVTVPFMVAQPSIMDFSFTYQYDIPGTDFTSRLRFGVLDLANDINLFDESDVGGPGIFEPSSGTHEIEGSIELPAGIELTMGALMRLNTTGGGSSVIGNANGTASITITPIPEPHTALLLLLGVTSIIRRRARRDELS